MTNEVKIPKGRQFVAYDQPEDRDFMFDDREELAKGNDDKKRPKNKFKVQNQGNTPACTMFSGVHVANGLNLLEDQQLGVNREQVNPLTLWETFCAARGYSNSGSSIQTIALWLKNNGYIEGYVTIPVKADKTTQIRQMKAAIDMGNFISTGSAYGDRGTIKKTGVYSDRADRYFVGHARCVVDYVLDSNGEVEYFWAINSYGDKRGPYNGYFKLYPADVTKAYSKLCFIDKNDSANFKDLTEIQKIKQAINILRQIYHTTPKTMLRAYLDNIQMGKNFSDIYGVII